MRGTQLRLAGIFALALAACGDSAFASKESATSGGDFGGDPSVPTSDAGTGGGGAAESDTADPSEERDAPLMPPAAGRRYVYVPSPSIDRVARVDSLTLDVRPIRVGDNPRVVKVSPEGDRAVALNVGSDDVSLLEQGDEVARLDVLKGCNALELSPDGQVAIAWFDNAASQPGDEVGSISEVAWVDLDARTVKTLTVGFLPSRVAFSASGDRVSVLSRDGLSTLTVADAATQTVLPLVRFAGTGDGARVDVSRSGRLAVFREPERLGLRVEDLVAGDEVFVELAAEAGDLDFLDETTLLLTLPSRRSLAVVSLEAALAGQPALSEVSVDGDVRPLASSLAPGKVALYSTSANRRVISVVDPTTGAALTATALRKTVWSLLPSQSGTRGIVLHDGDPTFAGNDLLATVERSAGYSVIDFERGYSHLNLSPVRPSAVVEAPDGSAAYLMIADKTLGIRRVDRVDYGSLTTQSFEFDGVPEAIGLMEETGQLYVSQTGAGGRITFVDLATGERHEISAYELNAYIE